MQPYSDLPDPVDVAAYLALQRGDEHHTRICRAAARYIMAGLELARRHRQDHPEDDD